MNNKLIYYSTLSLYYEIYHIQYYTINFIFILHKIFYTYGIHEFESIIYSSNKYYTREYVVCYPYLFSIQF